MLKGISPLLSPELLDTLYRMGHGDEIVGRRAFSGRDGRQARCSCRWPYGLPTCSARSAPL